MLESHLPDQLIEYETLLRQAGFPAITHMREGTTWPYPVWDDYDERPPIPPWEIRQWWAWHDGCTHGWAQTAYEHEFSFGWEVLSSHDAVDAYADERLGARTTFEHPDEWFPKQMLPIAQQGNGDLLLIETDHPTRQLRALRQDGIGLVEQPVARSFADVIRSNVELLRAGARTFDSRHGWTTHPDLIPTHLKHQNFVDLTEV